MSSKNLTGDVNIPATTTVNQMTSVSRKEEGHDNQKIGDLAADYVKLWADVNRFTVNESKRDRYGWDHYYEFYAKST
jgi:hypothetical protein